MSEAHSNDQSRGERGYACSHCSTLFQVNHQEEDAVICPGCENMVSIRLQNQVETEGVKVVPIDTFVKVDVDRNQQEDVSLIKLVFLCLLLLALFVAVTLSVLLVLQ